VIDSFLIVWFLEWVAHSFVRSFDFISQSQRHRKQTASRQHQHYCAADLLLTSHRRPVTTSQVMSRGDAVTSTKV